MQGTRSGECRTMTTSPGQDLMRDDAVVWRAKLTPRHVCRQSESERLGGMWVKLRQPCGMVAPTAVPAPARVALNDGAVLHHFWTGRRLRMVPLERRGRHA